MSHPVWSHYIVSFDKESINSYKKGLTLVECLPYSTDCSLYVYSSDHLSKPSGGYYWSLRCGEIGWFPWGHTAGGREKADQFENPYSYPYCNHSVHYPTENLDIQPIWLKRLLAVQWSVHQVQSQTYTWGWIPASHLMKRNFCSGRRETGTFFSEIQM